MSVINRAGERVELAATPPNFWRSIRDEYGHSNGRRWRALAALALVEGLGWTEEMAALALGFHRDSVRKANARTRRELAARFKRPL